MSRIRWLLVVLTFLPNLGVMSTTRYGQLVLSDIVMSLYVAYMLVWYGLSRASWTRSIHQDRRGSIAWIAALFLFWAVVSTVTAGVRFEDVDANMIPFGLLKIGKLLLYVGGAYLTVMGIKEKRDQNALLWSLLLGVTIASVSLPFTTGDEMGRGQNPVEGFVSLNATSVEIAIVLCLLVAAYERGWGSQVWKRVSLILLPMTVLGFVFSQGRGGWLAAVVGLTWFAVRVGPRKKVLVSVAMAILLGAAAYVKIPAFRYQVDLTFQGDPVTGHGSVLRSISESGRPRYWKSEGSKVFEYPLLGRGFFNRFPGSGLDWVGSHNFFIQMFLETGIVGGLLVVALWWQTWKGALERRVVPVEAALVAGLVGGMGGEYFYGGMTLYVVCVCGLLGLVMHSAAVGAERKLSLRTARLGMQRG